MTSPSGSKTFSYAGTTVTVTNERGYPTTYGYVRYADPDSGFLASISTPVSGTSVGIGRDVFGHMTYVSQGGVTRTYGLNANKFVASITDPESGTTSFGRDAVGNMTSRAVGGVMVSYGYDGLDRMTSIVYGGSAGSVSLTYDGRSKVTSVNNGITLREFQYDGNGNRTLDRLTIDGRVFAATYAYSATDGLNSVTYPAGLGTVFYNADIRGRPTQASPYLTSVGYHSASNNLASLSYANGRSMSFTEIAARQLPNGVSAPGISVDLDYTYDAVGNITQIGYLNGELEYKNFSYDAVDRLMTWGSGKSFIYDGNGNMTYMAEPGRTKNLSYSSGRLASVTQEGVTTSFEYDLRGNTTAYRQNGQVQKALSYDNASQVTCVFCGEANEVQYVYDGNGSRVKETKGGKTTYFFHGANNDLLYEYSPYGKTWKKHVYLSGKRVATKSGSDATVTNISLTTLPAQPAYGSLVEIRAAVNPSNATGSIEFTWNGQTIVGTLVNGVATISTSALPVGNVQLTASYDGDANYAPSNSSLSVSVSKRASAVALAVAPVTPTLGGSVTLTATITGSQPSGVVEFRNGGTLIGTSFITNGVATLALGPLGAGDYQFGASYGGDSGHLGSSTSSAISLSIAKQEPTLQFTSTPQTLAAGQLVTLTANLTGPVTPTGFVTFKTAGGSVLSLSSLSNGVASIGLTNLPVGSNQLLVEYGGDPNYLAKISPTVSVEVAKVPTVVQLTPPVGALVAGQSLQFAVTVSGSQPTGTVRLLRGGIEVAAAVLSNGSASIRIAAKSGTHSFSAAYVGDANNQSGESDAYSVTAQLRAARNDLDGDGRADVVMHDQSTGSVVARLMNGFSVTATGTVAQVADTGWQIVGSGDFDGDGKSDLLWRHGLTGEVWMYRMNGSAIVANQSVTIQPDTLWKIVGVGDFNGDGMSDILWRNAANGDVHINLMNGFSIVQSQTISQAPDPAWQIAAVADFDGNGKSDILWQNAVSGEVSLFKMNGLAIEANLYVHLEPDTLWQIVTAGDVNGDAMADIIWQNRSTGQVIVHIMDGATVLSGGAPHWEPDLSWRIVSSADYDGDGKSDLLWHNTQTGRLWVHLMNGLQIAAGQEIFTVPTTSWKPASDITSKASSSVPKSDLNLDGRGDLLWAESASQAWASFMNGRTVLSSAPYPSPGAGYQLIATDDFNGDGRGDLLWFRASDRALYLTLLSHAAGAMPEPQSGPIGTIGVEWELRGITDLNQDGKADLVWFNTQTRQASGWFMDGRSILPSSFGYGSIGPGYEVIGAADFNGDGRGDILWFNYQDRTLRIGINRHAAGPEALSGLVGSIGAEWELRAVGDMNGDGRADLVWFNPQTRAASAWFMNGTTILPSSMGFGTGGEGYEVVGLLDLNGDRRDDIVWLRASDRTYYATIVGHASAMPEPISGQIGVAGAGSVLRSGKLSPGGFENQAPVVSIWVLRTGDNLFVQPATIAIFTTATDSDGIAKIEVFANEIKIKEFVGVYQDPILLTDVAAGSYAIKVRATDSRGAFTDSNVENVHVRLSAPLPVPFVSLTVGLSQGGGHVAPASVTLLADAGVSPSGFITDQIARVEFFANNVKLGEDTTEPYSFGWHNVPAGSHLVYARATTTMGVSRNSSLVTVVVSSPPVAAGRVKNDLNGDGKSDLIWQNADRVTQGWLMNGAAADSTATLLPQGSEWRVRHIADFNGDGKDDLLLQGEGGAIQMRLMDGLSVIATESYLSPASAWRAFFTGDINGDGKADIIFGAEEGTWVIWLMSGTTKISESNQFGFPGNAGIEAVADLNNDGKADLVWFGEGGTVTKSWLMDGVVIPGSFPPPPARIGTLGSAPGEGWYLHSATDLDGDHRAELVWQHPDGRVQFQRTDGLSVTTSVALATAGSPWAIAGIGDFDADGHKDLVLEDPQGQIAIWRISATGTVSTHVIASAADRLTVRHVADFNGDGKSDLVLQHEDTADVLWLMDGHQVIGTATPIAAINTYEVVPGDGRVIDANTPPEASLTMEGDRRIFVGLANLQMEGIGSDSNGDAVRLQLFRNGVVVADRSSSLEGFTETITAPGTFTYFVRATDAVGATRDSAPIAVTVAPLGSVHFDSDAKSDFFWRNPDTGENHIWFMDGLTIKPTQGPVRASTSAWIVGGLADFDGDGKADVLLRNQTTGETYMYPMDGTAILPSEGNLRTLSADWVFAGTGDFDGDGKSDILLRNTSTGENYIWIMNGRTIMPDEGYIRTVPVSWKVVSVIDFDGDSKSDILWRNTTTGENYIYFMDGTTIKQEEGFIRTVPAPWEVAGTGDFDADGRGDILWQYPPTGETWVYFMSGLTIKPSEGPIATLPAGFGMTAIGDYDGDGKSDILLRNQTTGANHMWFMNGRTIKPTQGGIPVLGSPWVPVRR